MANNITYVSALVSIRDYAKENGFDNEEILNKIQKLIDQKSKGKNPNTKSQARKDNEVAVDNIIRLMKEKNITEIDNKWVRDNIVGVNSPARATAVLSVGVEMNKLIRHTIAKSASRNTFTFTLAETEESA